MEYDRSWNLYQKLRSILLDFGKVLDFTLGTPVLKLLGYMLGEYAVRFILF